MSTLWTQMRNLNPYEIHKLLINEYVLKKPGDTTFLKRDTSKDRNDLDVIRDNHKFLWDEGDNTDSWELKFAKRYYDKLFKEYCIGDLILYKENKIALRWRTEKEVVIGKGQFICGNKRCVVKDHLRTWEVNFAYVEHGSKKNALVKIRLCPDCSNKLNYHSKKREIKRLKKTKHRSKTKGRSISESEVTEPSSSSIASESNIDDIGEEVSENNKFIKTETDNEDSLWEKNTQIESKTREEEMDEYLQDLLL